MSTITRIMAAALLPQVLGIGCAYAADAAPPKKQTAAEAADTTPAEQKKAEEEAAAAAKKPAPCGEKVPAVPEPGDYKAAFAADLRNYLLKG